LELLWRREPSPVQKNKEIGAVTNEWQVHKRRRSRLEWSEKNWSLSVCLSVGSVVFCLRLYACVQEIVGCAREEDR